MSEVARRAAARAAAAAERDAAVAQQPPSEAKQPVTYVKDREAMPILTFDKVNQTASEFLAAAELTCELSGEWTNNKSAVLVRWISENDKSLQSKVIANRLQVANDKDWLKLKALVIKHYDTASSIFVKLRAFSQAPRFTIAELQDTALADDYLRRANTLGFTGNGAYMLFINRLPNPALFVQAAHLATKTMPATIAQFPFANDEEFVAAVAAFQGKRIMEDSLDERAGGANPWRAHTFGGAGSQDVGRAVGQVGSGRVGMEQAERRIRPEEERKGPGATAQTGSTCFRCGRVGHVRAKCKATAHSNGKPLPDEPPGGAWQTPAAAGGAWQTPAAAGAGAADPNGRGGRQ